jgi:hypothetical protein
MGGDFPESSGATPQAKSRSGSLNRIVRAFTMAGSLQADPISQFASGDGQDDAPDLT